MLSDEDKDWIRSIVVGRLDATEERMKEFAGQMAGDMETRIIAEFWKWGRSADIRYRQDHSVILSLDARVQAVEDRITDLERSK